jgi:hypothetical protein
MRRLCLALICAACGGDDDAIGGDGGAGADAACEEPGRPAAIVYLNRDGATFGPGPESSIDNTTTVVDAERVFPPHPHDNWSQLAACFRAGLDLFHIDVVEEDPGAEDHTEVVFSAGWSDPLIGSISSFSCGSGYPRGTAFIFADRFEPDDTRGQCNVALQQFAAVAAGLEHTFDCRDYMSVLDDCPPKSWVDEPMACGVFDEAACECRERQNSYRDMLSAFGRGC